MAKGKSITHYRQAGENKFPTTLPYSEFAVAKDGSVAVGVETDNPVEVAKKTDLDTHSNDTTKHITAVERENWNKKASQTDLTTHVNDTTKHVPSGGTEGQVLISNGDGTSSWQDASGGSVCDQVIRTQADFEALIASPTWLGAKSVCFVGDGGTLKFTRSDGQGIKIPQTVKQIKGMNSVIIEVTSFDYSYLINSAAFWYETRPDTIDYSINDLEMNCKSSGGGISYGFRNCTQLTNCKSRCDGNAASFASCTKLVNCIGYGRGYSKANGFDNCHQLTNCIGTGDCYYSTDANSGRGFSYCYQLTNCIATGINNYDNGSAYGIYSCHYLSNCKPSDTPSKTAFLGGTNTHVDSATVG